MAGSDGQHPRCSVCGRILRPEDAIPANTIRPPIVEAIRLDHPEWDQRGYVCREDLALYRMRYIEDLLERERGDLDHLEQEVLESLSKDQLLSRNVNEAFEERRTFGQLVADTIARFGGSWGFILLFGLFLGLWIALNTVQLLAQPFDPFPYILLNLILSCLAAIQAPVIMMSQNRQEARDRLRGEYDYQVNLKAELEIRQLHEKLDFFLTRQWRHHLEIQRLQMDMIKELASGQNTGDQAS